MTESELPAPFFIADDPALDFLDSVATPRDEEIEWIGNGSDFLDWLDAAGLVPPDVVETFRARTPPEQLDAVAGQARKLREWFRGFVNKHAGRPLSESALDKLDPINTILAADTTYPKIAIVQSAGGSKFGWRRERRWSSPQTPLLPLAEAMGELVCQVDFSQVKNCEGPSCTMWFHDVTKNHTRRWCDMNICGNRAKAAAHRAKQRTGRRARA
ncbi:MAG: CGNR zinc finger domain-containing protein [Alphaproteobacteria bacterium]|nr:CGNR zinc finger domain-containing protein [Alphaproteobacteria bacterium]